MGQIGWLYGTGYILYHALLKKKLILKYQMLRNYEFVKVHYIIFKKRLLYLNKKMNTAPKVGGA